MELGNILFVVAFIVVPVMIGIWALRVRRQLGARSSTSSVRTAPRPESHTPTVLPPRGEPGGPVEPFPPPSRYEQLTRSLPKVEDDQATRQIPQVKPLPRVVNRRFYPPRYVGRSGGIVKRVIPADQRPFLSSRSKRVMSRF